MRFLPLLSFLLIPGARADLPLNVYDPTGTTLLSTHQVQTPYTYFYGSGYLSMVQSDFQLIHIYPDVSNFSLAKFEIGPSPTALPPSRPAFLELDGRWYQAAQFATIGPGQYDVGLTGAVNCRLPTGALPQSPPMPWVLVDGAPIALATGPDVRIWVQWKATAYAVRMTTATGNVICDNAVQPPAAFLVDPIFKSSFE